MTQHFVSRLSERAGIPVSEAKTARAEIALAISDRRDDFVEEVARDQDKIFWRFMIKNEVMYAIQDQTNGNLVTVLTQSQFGQTRKLAKLRASRRSVQNGKRRRSFDQWAAQASRRSEAGS